MTELNIRPKRPEDDDWSVNLANRLNDHLPASTVEEYRHWEAIDNMNENAHNERFVAEHDGSLVGYGRLEKMWWTKNPGGFFATVVVEPELWGKGNGKQLYDHLMIRLADLGAQRLYCNVREDRVMANAFIQSREFTPTGHMDRWSRLPVADANLDAGYTGVEERLASEGIVIKTLAEIGAGEAFLRKLHSVSDEAVRDIPMSEEFTESPYEMFLKELEDPNLTHDRVWIALDGDQPAGLVIFPRRGETSAFNGFTGVARAYRGKGVARALKLKSIQWAQANGIDYIYTANDINNERMLAINNQLGYQRLPSSAEFVKTL